jgi:hypothetical protein
LAFFLAPRVSSKLELYSNFVISPEIFNLMTLKRRGRPSRKEGRRSWPTPALRPPAALIKSLKREFVMGAATRLLEAGAEVK